MIFVFKKALSYIVFILVLSLVLSPVSALAASSPAATVSIANISKGVVSVSYTSPTKAKVVVRVMKDKVINDYEYLSGAQYPLQLGNGAYSVLVLEQVSGTKYKLVHTEKVELKLENENAVYLQPISYINWSEKTKFVVKAKELVKDAKTDAEKVKILYAYLTKLMKYDYEKAKTVTTIYSPNLDTLYDSLKGICFDYTSVFAAMLRGVGVPTKLLMGYEAGNAKVYHSWNEVYLGEKEGWVTVDTTFDAIKVQNGQAVEMVKDSASYTATKVY